MSKLKNDYMYPRKEKVITQVPVFLFWKVMNAPFFIVGDIELAKKEQSPQPGHFNRS